MKENTKKEKRKKREETTRICYVCPSREKDDLDKC